MLLEYTVVKSFAGHQQERMGIRQDQRTDRAYAGLRTREGNDGMLKFVHRGLF